jgi:signal-transduction protein with cAMP-binding, CBS, and nucleotidyltransferase domain
MRISDVMHTPPVTCTPRLTLREAAQLMETRNVGCVIVVDAVDDVVGIVTDRDIALRAVAAGRSGDIAVEEVMTRDVATVSPRVDVREAGAIMMKRGVRRLPVVDEHGVLHGLVALDDLMRNLGHEAEELTELLVVQATRLPPNG